MSDNPWIRKFLRREGNEQTVHVRCYGPHTRLAAYFMVAAIEHEPEVEVIRRTNFESGFGDSTETSVSWTSCEVGPDEQRHLVTGVCLFLVHHGLGDLRFVLCLVSDRDIEVQLVVRNDDQGQLPELLAWIDALEERHHPLKGKLFSLSPTGLAFLPSQEVGRDDLVLPEEVLQTVERNFAFLDDPDRFPPALRHRALLLAGPPGVGKTMLAKWLSGRFRCTSLWVTPGALWEIGPAPIFKLASRLRPTLLILEDLDLAAGERRGNQPLGELLGRLDGFNDLTDIAVIATTNHAEVLDEALDPERRPGRFNRLLHIGLPTAELRARLVRSLVAGSAVVSDLDHAAVERLVALTDGCTGAQIVETVRDLELRRLWAEREGDKVGLEALLTRVSDSGRLRRRTDFGFTSAEAQ